ncbi:MAG: DUF805 domain-containing protein [Flavobacteriales bacterium]|jgi:uncharacterized membrane protein YhaH (DUF805 family)|nr:DUF805 domain-containing protein [Flavobacteriales bacterium]
MEWYLKVVKDNYANFQGRARRKEYWMFILFNFLISVGLSIIENILGLASSTGTGMISSLYSIAVLVPSIAVAIRRLHDTGKSGWNLLWFLLPVIGWIILIVYYVKEGDQGSNEYGADPKGNEIDEIGR